MREDRSNTYVYDNGWKGVYFKKTPLQLTAIPDSGYTFLGWGGDTNCINDTLIITPHNSLKLLAFFEKTENQPSKNTPKTSINNGITLSNLNKSKEYLWKLYSITGNTIGKGYITGEDEMHIKTATNGICFLILYEGKSLIFAKKLVFY